jgi:hypothetical protein
MTVPSCPTPCATAPRGRTAAPPSAATCGTGARCRHPRDGRRPADGRSRSPCGRRTARTRGLESERAGMGTTRQFLIPALSRGTIRGDGQPPSRRGALTVGRVDRRRWRPARVGALFRAGQDLVAVHHSRAAPSAEGRSMASEKNARRPRRCPASAPRRSCTRGGAGGTSADAVLSRCPGGGVRCGPGRDGGRARPAPDKVLHHNGGGTLTAASPASPSSATAAAGSASVTGSPATNPA